MISVLGAEKLSLVEIEAFLAASESVRFAGCGRTEIYGWVERLLCHHEYPLQKRRAKGLLRAYVEHMTGLSRAQSTRLIGVYVKAGRVAPKPSLRPRFQRHYSVADVELLASVDDAHERLSGPATRHILKREFEVYGKPEFERLARLSNGHLYNLRRSPRYGLRHYEKTRPTAVQIGERKKPAPNGQPGFLRIDTVHQGDGPEGKGIYHINAVDELTQWEVVLATPRISEAWLMPCSPASSSSSPLSSSTSTPTTEAISSTKPLPSCLKNCSSSRPKAALAAAATTDWWRPKTRPSCANTSAGNTSRRPTPRPSTSSTPASSTPTSTTTHPPARLNSSSTPRAANGAFIR